MSGSSGYGSNYPPLSPRQIDDLVNQSGDDTQEKATSTEIERAIDEKLSEINDHDYEAIDRHRTEIENKLCESYEGVEVIRYGGSHSRHTDVSGISDIDILVPMGDATNTPTSSNQAIGELANVLRERYPTSTIETGKMAVTIKFSDGIEVQILPAYKVEKNHYRIPDPNSSGWIETKPDAFAKKLTAANKQQGNMVIPVIKMAKYLCNKFGIEVNSYHLENMAVESLSRYSGKLNKHEMLQYVFNRAKTQTRQQMPDPSGQSKDVAGDISTTERRLLARGFNSLEQKISEANTLNSSEAWSSLLE